MKRFLNYYLSLTLIASLFVVASCSEDEDPVIDGPGITLTGLVGDETTVDVGEDLDFTVNVTAPGGFNRLVIFETVGDNSTRSTLIDTAKAPGEDPTTFTLPVSYPVTPEVAGERVLLEFWVVGEDQQETTLEYTLIVNEAQVVSYNTVLLAAPVPEGTKQVWFSTSTGEKYSTQEVNNTTQPVSRQIDFGYRYGPSQGATLASPAAYPSEGKQNTSGWATPLNQTRLRRVSSGASESDFMEMGTTLESLATAYDNATEDTASPNTTQRLTNLRAGDVLAFMTDPTKPEEAGGKFGLIYVEEINMGTDRTGYGSDAYISLNVKVQP